MEAVNTHIMQNNKIKHTFVIYHPLHLLSCKHTLSPATFQVCYLLQKALHSGRHHMTFCYCGPSSWCFDDHDDDGDDDDDNGGGGDAGIAVCFKVFDCDRDGVLSADELRHMLSAMLAVHQLTLSTSAADTHCLVCDLSVLARAASQPCSQLSCPNVHMYTICLQFFFYLPWIRNSTAYFDPTV